MDFDFLYDLELDWTAVGIALVFTCLLYLFMFEYAGVIGWDIVPVGYRIITLIGCLPVCYFAASYMLNK